MSYAIDANLLLYAANSSCEENVPAVRFLTECAESSETLCIPWTTLQAFLRISTHPAIFPRPLSWAQARRYVAALLDLPQVRTLAELESFWEVLRAVGDEVMPRGNLVSDAHLAAVLKQNGVKVLYTCDRDFRRFPFLEVRDPLR